MVRENSNEYIPQQNDGYQTKPNSNDCKLSTHCWGDTIGTPDAHLPLEMFSNTSACIDVVLTPGLFLHPGHSWRPPNDETKLSRWTMDQEPQTVEWLV